MRKQSLVTDSSTNSSNSYNMRCKAATTTMDSEKDKWLLISKARVVSQSKVDLNNIFVNPDLTKTERDLQYQLRQEVRRRREQGENVKIRKGKVIVVQNQ